jgi:hydrogenase nickel incorporation protein HypA/HybF
VLRCRECAAEHPMGEYIAYACASCGSIEVDVLSGEEFLVTALELAEV